jgi:drug/metabolite transporter (DMT)-like permease
LLYAVCALIWGTTWFGIRVCIGPGGYPTFAAAAVRFAISGALLGAVYALGWGRPGPRTRSQFRALVGCGALSAIAYALVYAAERSVPGGVAAVIYGTFPLCTALFAKLGNVEKVTRRSLAGSAVAFAGIAVVFVDRLEVSGAQGIGVLLLLASVVASSLYSTILKRASQGVHSLAATGVFLGTAAVMLAVFAVAVERRPVPWPPPVVPTIALAYLAVVGSVLVFAAYMSLLKRVSLMTVSTLAVLEPIVALLVDAVGERDVVLVPRTYAGVAVTIAGVALSVLPGARGRARGLEQRRPTTST